MTLLTDDDLPIAYLESQSDDWDFRGTSGNTIHLLGMARGWFRQLKCTEYNEQFSEEALRGDYSHVLQTLDRWFGTSFEERFNEQTDWLDE